jgi:hypothetical protein
MFTLMITGGILFLIGLIVLFCIGKKKLTGGSTGGFVGSLFTSFIEVVAGAVLTWVGVVLAVAGFIWFIVDLIIHR